MQHSDLWKLAICANFKQGMTLIPLGSSRSSYLGFNFRGVRGGSFRVVEYRLDSVGSIYVFLGDTKSLHCVCGLISVEVKIM